jgi:8-oxo-dGTP diphosphatase
MENQMVRVGTAAIIRQNGKILLIKRNAKNGFGKWCPPGGHLEMNEEPSKGAEREVLEEVGIKVKNMRFMGITNDIYEDLGEHYITTFFECEPLTTEVKTNSEALEFGWFAMQDLPKPLFQPFKSYVEGKLVT